MLQYWPCILAKCHVVITSVIRQKGKSQNGCFKKTKHGKFSEKRAFFTPWYAHLRVKNVYFSEKFDVLCFLETPVLRFALLLYYWRLNHFTTLSQVCGNVTIMRSLIIPILRSSYIISREVHLLSNVALQRWGNVTTLWLWRRNIDVVKAL